MYVYRSLCLKMIESTNVYLNVLFSIERLRYRSCIHNLYWSNQSIPWSTILGGSVFPYAVYTRDRLTVWHARGSRHLIGWYETLPKLTKGYDYRGIAKAKCFQFMIKMEIMMYNNLIRIFIADLVFIMFRHINRICSWCRQLHFSTDGQFCRQLLPPDHRIFWMHSCGLCLWHKTVIYGFCEIKSFSESKKYLKYTLNDHRPTIITIYLQTQFRWWHWDDDRLKTCIILDDLLEVHFSCCNGNYISCFIHGIGIIWK